MLPSENSGKQTTADQFLLHQIMVLMHLQLILTKLQIQEV